MVNIGYGVVRRLSGDASISKASEGDIAYGYGVIYLASDDVTPETADAFTLDALPNPADFIPTESRTDTVIIDEESIGKDDAGNNNEITVVTVHGAHALVPKQVRALEAMEAIFSWPKPASSSIDAVVPACVESGMAASCPFQHLFSRLNHRLMRGAARTENVEELLPERICRRILADEIADVHDLIGIERHLNDAVLRWMDSPCDVVAIMLREQPCQRAHVAERDMAMAGKVGERLFGRICRTFRALKMREALYHLQGARRRWLSHRRDPGECSCTAHSTCWLRHRCRHLRPHLPRCRLCL